MKSLNIPKNEALSLYNKQGLSAREIAEKFGVRIDRVYSFFKREKISRRSAAEQNRLRFERSPLSFSIRKRLTKRQQKLMVAGVMLYWGEGSQWAGESTVDFANSNAIMIKVFAKFLREICNVNEKRLRGFLYCYSNQSPKKLIKYWSNVIGIPIKQFTKPYIKKAENSLKNHKMPYGLVHIRYSDKRLLLLMRKWIKILPQKLIV